MNAQIVTVNLIPDLCVPVVVRVSQYDVARPITFKVLDGTSTATLTANMTATIVGTKPSGLGFSETGTISGSTVTLNTTLTMTQECGMIPAEIRLTKTGENIGTANFILAVEPSPHPDGTTDGTQETMANLETRLQGQIDDLDARVDAIEGDQSIIDDINALNARVTALEQGGSGLSSTEKQLILTLFSKAAYAEDDAGTAYDALENLWTTTTRTITYNLSHVSSSNSTASIESGQSYTTTLTASTNYTLNSVTVTMGGVDITSTAYSSGTITIPSVTGNIVIMATAVLAAQSITATYTQSGTVYDTATLDSLKADLVVTANYAGGTSETVPASDYTLSGTLTVGTSTITVSYAGLTDTFSVTVVHSDLPSGYTAYDYIKRDVGWGTQVKAYGIHTNAQISTSDTVEMKLYIPSGLGSDLTANPLFGTRTGRSGAKELGLFVRYNDTKLGYWYDGTDTTTNIYATKDVINTIKIQPVGASETYPNNATINVNGTDNNTGSTSTGKTFSSWFGIFTYAISATENNGNTIYDRGEMLGEINVTDSNGVDKYHFIPASHQGVYGFYESVNGNFFYNETYGSTGFTGGYWS